MLTITLRGETCTTEDYVIRKNKKIEKEIKTNPHFESDIKKKKKIGIMKLTHMEQ